MPSILGLADMDTTREVRAGFLGRRTRLETYTFADWTVDGVPLRDLVRLQGGGRHPTVLGPPADVTYLVEGPEVDYLSPVLAFEFERSAYDKTLLTAKRRHEASDVPNLRGATRG